MNQLPKVRKEIKFSIFKALEDMEDSDSKLIYLQEFWKGFRKEQPELTKILVKELEAFKHPLEMSAFAHGIWLIYASLRSQLEADEMNEDWGI
tara:strand:- start:1298 stop:1576 length:279 start_codon:yes stop_codon:yes gene_type:complete